MDKKYYIAMGGVVAASIVALAGCETISEAEKQGFSFETPNTGVELMSEELFNICGSWTPYNLAFEDDNKYEEVYYCTGDKELSLYMYKGVFAKNLQTLINSSYYKTQGEDKSEVYVDNIFKRGTSLVYKNNEYVEEIYEDPLKRFNAELDEKNADGVLVTEEVLDSNEWVESNEDPNVLISPGGSALFMGAVFASMLALQNSDYYKTNGINTSKIAVPSSYIEGRSSLAYANGKYYTDKENIRTTSGSVAVAPRRTAPSITKAKSSISSKSSSTTPRGSSGIGTGARGGGAS